ncbi:helix-turn-helix transcriptional regulator [Candidatus Kaiserbacteria bacterium]|nr:helix-turn-helix transcriptional regulator [Candidatus Kaiserbacteria bacterium]
MTTAIEKLVKNIKQIRRAKNMSQGDICRDLGCDRSFISNLESGKTNPTLMTIERIAAALGVDCDELLK